MQKVATFVSDFFQFADNLGCLGIFYINKLLIFYVCSGVGKREGDHFKSCTCNVALFPNLVADRLPEESDPLQTPGQPLEEWHIPEQFGLWSSAVLNDLQQNYV